MQVPAPKADPAPPKAKPKKATKRRPSSKK